MISMITQEKPLPLLLTANAELQTDRHLHQHLPPIFVQQVMQTLLLFQAPPTHGVVQEQTEERLQVAVQHTAPQLLLPTHSP
jgi:hypothetical protein